MNILVAHIENLLGVNSIFLLTKQAIYNAMKKGYKPHIVAMKCETKKLIIKKNKYSV